MITDSPDGFKAEAMFLPSAASGEDPLGQRSYLAIKINGGLAEVVYDDDTKKEAVDALLGEIETRCRKALEEALQAA